jgi:hypothetical protein
MAPFGPALHSDYFCYDLDPNPVIQIGLEPGRSRDRIRKVEKR